MLPQLFVLFALLLASWSSVASPHTLALNWRPEPQFGGFYEAKRQGLLDNEDFPVQLQEGGSGTPTVQMLSSGRVAMAILSADELLVARDRGADLVALFAVYQTSPQAIMVRKDHPAQNMKELFQRKGQMIALQAGLPYAQYLLEKFEGSRPRMVPYPGGISSFLADPLFAQQSFVTSEPLLAKIQGVETRSFLIAEEGFNPYVTVLAVRRRFLEENREKIEPFLKALRSAWTDYLENPTPTNALMHTLNPSMSEEVFKQSAKAQIPLIRPPADSDLEIGQMQEGRWAELISQLRSMGLIKTDMKASEVF